LKGFVRRVSTFFHLATFANSCLCDWETKGMQFVPVRKPGAVAILDHEFFEY